MLWYSGLSRPPVPWCGLLDRGSGVSGRKTSVSSRISFCMISSIASSMVTIPNIFGSYAMNSSLRISRTARRGSSQIIAKWQRLRRKIPSASNTLVSGRRKRGSRRFSEDTRKVSLGFNYTTGGCE